MFSNRTVRDNIYRYFIHNTCPMLWLKAIHICGMVFWYAGLMYLPRLFVYHSECEDVPGRQRFARMERRLYHGIMHLSVLLMLAPGLAMLMLHPGYLQQTWMQLKLGLVVLLLAYHGHCGLILHRLSTGVPYSGRFLRLYNEIPALMLIAIVFLVVVQRP